MKKKKTRVILLAVLISFAFFFLLERDFLPGISGKSLQQKGFEILEKIVNLIKDDYVDKPDPSKTMEGAFRGMVDSLDILSSYLNKPMVARHKLRKKNTLMESGIILYKKYGSYPLVIGLIENSPAEKKGIKIGQYISGLNGKSTLEMSMYEANLYLKDTKKSTIHLNILQSNEEKNITLERALLFKEPVSFAPENKTNGILKIHKLFSPAVSQIKKEILPQLKSINKPLIVDLRNCHEGEIEEARKFINVFLKSKKIGFFEKKNGKREIFSCPNGAEMERLPLIIWTNPATIGPAEVVAGVLQKYRKAKIIGFQTPGLIAKQNFYSLEDGSGLLLTSAVFQISPEEKIWGKGIKPDVKIECETRCTSTYLKESFKFLL